MSGNGKDVVDVPAGGGPSMRKRSAKQEFIPGTEPVKIVAVHRAIESYVEARDNRMGLTKIEVEKKAHLLTVMHNAGIVDYAVDGHEAHIEVDEQLKAKIRSDEDEPEVEVHELRAPRRRKARGKDASAGTD
jgi:hypothetical protein